MKIPTAFHLGLAKFRKRIRLIVAKLAGHGVFDIKHFRLLTNPNLPIWLAILLIGFDLLVTGWGTWRAGKTTVFGLRLVALQSS